jgi:hypothetical protein
LNLDNHWHRDSFEVTFTHDECDIMIPFWWILKHTLVMLSGSKVQFTNHNCKLDYTIIEIVKIDIEYDDTIVSDSEQS